MSFVHIHSKVNFWSIACVACVAVFLFACGGSDQRRSDTVQANKMLLDELGRLYDAYLSGDSVQARNSLLEEIRVIEGSEWLPLQDKATQLFISYSRQYVLHQNQQDEIQAEATWIKLRYWLLRRFELNGLETELAMREVEVFTPEKIVELIETWDRRENKGKLPHYRRGDQGLPDE